MDRQGTDAHPVDQLRCDPFRINHGYIRCHIQMHVLVVNTLERTEVPAVRCARTLAGVAVDLAAAVTIIIPRPLVNAVADSGTAEMPPVIALPLIGIKPRAVYANVLRDGSGAGARAGMVADPEALRARLARDQTNDGGTIIGIGAVPPPLVGTLPGRIDRVRMRGAFFPPRFWYNSSASKAVPVVTVVGAVSSMLA
jgi:hypothetical protein